MSQIVNQTAGYPQEMKPGMVVNSVSIDSMSRDDPTKLEVIAGIVGADVSEWGRRLSGVRGLARLQKIAVQLFGRSSFEQHVKIERAGQSFLIQCIRIPRNV